MGGRKLRFRRSYGALPGCLRARLMVFWRVLGTLFHVLGALFRCASGVLVSRPLVPSPVLGGGLGWGLKLRAPKNSNPDQTRCGETRAERGSRTRSQTLFGNEAPRNSVSRAGSWR